MKIFGATRSPFVRKTRIVLAEKKVPFEFVITDVVPAQSEVIALNPLGQVPCLVTDDGLRLYDSKVIAEYVDSLGEQPALIPAHNARERAIVKCWETLADGVADAGILIRWELNQRAPQYRDPAWLERKRLRMSDGIAAMSAQLGERRHCFGDTLSLADIAVGAALGWVAFRFPDMDWQQDYPHLATLLASLESRPSFQGTRPS